MLTTSLFPRQSELKYDVSEAVSASVGQRYSTLNTFPNMHQTALGSQVKAQWCLDIWKQSLFLCVSVQLFK